MARWYCAASWKVRWPDTRPNPTPEARHTDPRITTEVYGHLVPGYLRDAINKLPLAGAADLLPAKARRRRKRTSVSSAGFDGLDGGSLADCWRQTRAPSAQRRERPGEGFTVWRIEDTWQASVDLDDDCHLNRGAQNM